MSNLNKSVTSEFSGKIAIATTTLYDPDSEYSVYRSEITRNTIRKATDLGYEIFVVDGGSSEELLKEFERYGVKVCQEKSMGMGKSRREVIRLATTAGKEIIAWTEPEKESYIKEIEKTALPILEECADIVVPRRKSLLSYPINQQYAETLGNLLWKELTGYNLDIWFGPKTWKRELSDYFLNYNGEYGDKWDSIFIPVMDIINDTKAVISLEVEYTHPAKQTQVEEHNITFHRKRIEQLYNLTTNLELHWRKTHSSDNNL